MTSPIIGDSEHPARPAKKARVPSLNVKRRGKLSCVTEIQDARGRFIEAKYFDVPEEEYGDGNMTGYRLAAEYLVAMKTGSAEVSFIQLVEAAVAALGEPLQQPIGRRGAAVGFLFMLHEFLRLAAQHISAKQYVDARIARYDQLKAKLANDEKEERFNFARRMEIAKAAKARRNSGKVNHHG